MGYVPDGPVRLVSRRWLYLGIVANVLLALAVVYWSFRFPSNPDMDLLLKGLREQEIISVKEIDLVKGKTGEWTFGTVVTDDGTRYPIAAKWTIDRTKPNLDEMRVVWIVGDSPAAVEQIEQMKLEN